MIELTKEELKHIFLEPIESLNTLTDHVAVGYLSEKDGEDIADIIKKGEVNDYQLDFKRATVMNNLSNAWKAGRNYLNAVAKLLQMDTKLGRIYVNGKLDTIEELWPENVVISNEEEYTIDANDIHMILNFFTYISDLAETFGDFFAGGLGSYKSLAITPYGAMIRNGNEYVPLNEELKLQLLNDMTSASISDFNADLIAIMDKGLNVMLMMAELFNDERKDIFMGYGGFRSYLMTYKVNGLKCETK